MYVFPGIFPFIERVAKDTGRDLHQVGQTRQLWHLKQIQDALGQLPQLNLAARRESIANIRRIRDGLALAIAGVDAAIEDVLVNTEPVVPEEPTRTTTTTKRRA